MSSDQAGYTSFPAVTEPDRIHVERMIETQLYARGFRDRELLRAFSRVPRHWFVSEAFRYRAYEDTSLPIGEGQTISQPETIAKILSLLKLKPWHDLLEIGGGSGYQAAVASYLAGRVVSVERIGSLAARARTALAALGRPNVTMVDGDGFGMDFSGFTADDRFDRVILACASPLVAPQWISVLRPGGVLALPLGLGQWQELVVVTRGEDGRLEYSHRGPARFVPLVTSRLTTDRTA